ncbi:cupin domain-containing protein [Bradyrhizobium sp. CCBAU 11361]|uniref:cupin domain-containing protein n=1 Tax=Bradyrhizobium sp. CCBAU 11361 TaxID=1630812 RepID=UPI003FA48CF5
MPQELTSAYGRIAGVQAPAFLRWLGLSAFSIDTKGYEITGLLTRRALRSAAVPLLATAIVLAASPAIAQDREQVKVVFEHALPNVEGKRLVSVLVSYPPAAKSLPHHHAASAFIYAYVLSGAIRSQVDNDPPKVYHQGEAFYEMPGSHHTISENASETEPASLLAVFVVDAKHDALTTPDKAPGSR